MRIALAVLVLHAVLLTAGDRPADPRGFYEGTAKSKQAGNLDVTLNLRRLVEPCEGQLATPVGNFALNKATVEAGRLRLQFHADGSPLTIDARLASGVLRGTFRVGDDTGAVELRRVGESKPIVPSAPDLNISKERWREDLRYLARELPKRHANAFHRVTRQQFEGAVAEADRRLDHAGADAAYVGLNRVATLVGDAHTYVEFPPDRAALAVGVEQFGDEYRIVRAAAGLERALGTRLVKVHGTPIARVRELLLSMTPASETPELAQARVTYFLSLGMVLHGFGVIPDRKEARLTLADDAGQPFALVVRALRSDEKPRWIAVPKEAPLYRQRPDESFWHTYLPESRAVYCSFRGYRDLGKHARDLLALVEKQRPDKLVIDLRQNGGGDYTDGLKYMIDPIRALPAVNAKGHLFVLVGPHTFSAAMSNAAQFRTRTAAILVGQTVGERPNSYQEVRQMTLPNSRLVVRYSTRYYRFVETGENVIRPDLEVIPSWADYRAGRDPVLDAALTYQAK
jgi:hypothetical protein